MPKFAASKPPHNGEGRISITIDTDNQDVLIEDYDYEDGGVRAMFLHFSTVNWIIQQVKIAEDLSAVFTTPVEIDDDWI